MQLMIIFLSLVVNARGACSNQMMIQGTETVSGTPKRFPLKGTLELPEEFTISFWFRGNRSIPETSFVLLAFQREGKRDCAKFSGLSCEEEVREFGIDGSSSERAGLEVEFEIAGVSLEPIPAGKIRSRPDFKPLEDEKNSTSAKKGKNNNQTNESSKKEPWNFVALSANSAKAAVYLKTFDRNLVRRNSGDITLRHQLGGVKGWFEIGGSEVDQNFAILNNFFLFSTAFSELELLSLFTNPSEGENFSGIRTAINFGASTSFGKEPIDFANLDPPGNFFQKSSKTFEISLQNYPAYGFVNSPSLLMTFKVREMKGESVKLFEFRKNDFSSNLNSSLINENSYSNSTANGSTLSPSSNLTKNQPSLHSSSKKPERLLFFSHPLNSTTSLLSSRISLTLFSSNSSNGILGARTAFESNDQKISAEFPDCLTIDSKKELALGFSLIQTDKKFISFLVLCGGKLRRSDDLPYSGPKIEGLDLVLLPEHLPEKLDIRILSVFVLENASSFATSSSLATQTCNSRCSIRTTKPTQCLQCHEGVLSPSEPTCLDFCPKGHKALSGQCVLCEKEKCVEAEPAHATFIPESERSFVLKLSKEIPTISAETLITNSSISIQPPTNFVQLNITAIDHKSFRVVISPIHSLFRHSLNFTFNQNSSTPLYDRDLNFIEDLSASTSLTIRFDPMFNRYLLSSFYVATLLALTIIIACLIFSCLRSFLFSIFPSNVFKMSLVSIIFIFSQPLILYVNVPAPSTLYTYLKGMFFFTYSMLGFFEWEFYPSSPNLYAHHPPFNFLQSFMLILILIGTFLVGFIVVKIVRCPKKIKKVFRTRSIMTLLFTFEPQFFVFFFTSSFVSPKTGGNVVATVLSSILLSYYLLGMLVFLLFAIFDHCLQDSKNVSNYFQHFNAGYQAESFYPAFDFARSFLRFVAALIALRLEAYPKIQIFVFICNYLITAGLLAGFRPWKLIFCTVVDIVQQALLILPLVILLSVACYPTGPSYSSEILSLIAIIALTLASIGSAAYIVFLIVQDLTCNKLTQRDLKKQNRTAEPASYHQTYIIPKAAPRKLSGIVDED